MTQGSITLKPRFWYILLTVFAIVFVLLYSIFDASYQKKKEEEQLLIAKRDQLNQEVHELRNEIEFVHSDAGIERYARAIGMIKPGEIKYNAVER